MHDWVVSTRTDAATGNGLPEDVVDLDGVTHTTDTAEYRLAKFKMEFENHFDMHYALIYYVYTFFALMVDQRAKNMFLTYWGSTGKWQPWFYDNDTSFAINNEGQLVFDYFHEDTDQLDGANVYNGQNSVLWTNFRNAFSDEIKETYQNLRNNGLITYDKLIDRFITNGSDKWSESIYNEDMDFKYISMLRSDNDATNLPQVRGSGEEHFRYFVENRLNYCDSKWYASDYANDYISLRIYTPTTWAGVEPNPAITVTPFSDMYAGVRYKANGTLYQSRVSHGAPVTFRPQGETFESENNETFNDTETAVYGAHQLSSIGDLAPLYCGSVNVANADKLIELKVGDGTEGYSNGNLRDLSVGTNKLLKKIDVRNCPNFTSVLDLSNCPSMEEVYAKGSSITGVNFPEAGVLKKAQLPGTITNFTLKHQLYVEELTFEGYDNIKTLWVENCPTVDGFDILSKAANVDRLRLTNVNLTYDTAAEMLALASRPIGGIDENGANTDKMWIDGKCHIKSLSGADYLAIKDAFPYMTITYDALVSQLIFMSEDGTTELGRQSIQNGGDGEYTGTTPTKESTAQYDFTFAGWSLTPGGSIDTNALKAVTADRMVYAAFSGALRSYTVRFYNGTTLLEAYTVEYGKDAVYKGSTPVNNSTGNPADFEFYGWKPEPTNIQGETNCYAQFYDKREITDDWATIAQACLDGTATEKYSIGAFKTLNIGEVKLPYEFYDGSAVVLNNEIHILGSDNSSNRTSHYKWNGTEWVSVSTLPYPFKNGSAVVYNDEIHILGGDGQYNKYTYHYKWDGSSWVSVSTLPYDYYYGHVVVLNNEIHILGSSNSSNRTSHYKWNGTEWTSVSTLPRYFFQGSAVVYNDEIHIMGGGNNGGTYTMHYKWNGTEWVSVSILPYVFNNGSAVVYNNEIHIIGGSSGTTNHYKYDGSNWTSVGTLPYEFNKSSAVVYNGEIHILGSYSSSRRSNHYIYSEETSKWTPNGVTESIPMEIIAHNHDELPDGVGKWEGIAKPTNIPQYGCAVTYQNEVHALGGNSSSSYTQHIKWDDTNSTWVTVSTLPYEFRSGCAVILNDEIHILGSYQTTNKTEHYKWNATDGWVSVGTLPYEFYCSSAVVLNNEIHILGSYDSSCRKYHYKWNGTEWTSVSTLPYKFYYGSAVVHNGEIHIFSVGSSGTKHYKWDGSAWTSVSTLPYNLMYGVATIINNEIHIFGGYDNPTGHYKWNGTEWTSMTTLPGNFQNYPLAVCNGTPYIFISTSCYKLAGASWEYGDNINMPSGVSDERTPVIINSINYICTPKGLYTISGSTLTEVHTSSVGIFGDNANALFFVYNNQLYGLSVLNTDPTYGNIYKYNGSAWDIETGWDVICPVVASNGMSFLEYNGLLHILTEDKTLNVYSQSHFTFDGTSVSYVNGLPIGAQGYGCMVVYSNSLCYLVGKNMYMLDGSVWSLKETFDFQVGCYRGCALEYNGRLFSCINNRECRIYDGVKWTTISIPQTKYLGINGSMRLFIERGRLRIFGNYFGNNIIFRNPRATLTFFAKEAMAESRPFNITDKPDDAGNKGAATGGWKLSDIRQYLHNEFYSMLSTELQACIKSVAKLTDGGYQNPAITTTDDPIWLASYTEVGGTNSPHTPDGQGEVYSVFTDAYSRVRKKTDGTPYRWWLRSGRTTNAYTIPVVSTGGNPYDTGYFAKEENQVSVVFGFCI